MTLNYLGDLVPMQQSLRPFDCTEPTYTLEDFLNAITANTIMAAGPEQVDLRYHEEWILKRIAMIQTALIGPAQQCYSHLPLKIRNNWLTLCRNFQKTFGNQQPQKQVKLVLESVTRASGERIKN